MYKTLTAFTDNVDGGVYCEGDIYPREGANPSEERIAYLMGNENKFGKSLLEKIGEPGKSDPSKEPKPKPIEKMTTAELEACAAEKGIDISSAKTNKDRCALIKAAEVATEE